jgi:hypothetical protein
MLPMFNALMKLAERNWPIGFLLQEQDQIGVWDGPGVATDSFDDGPASTAEE